MKKKIIIVILSILLLITGSSLQSVGKNINIDKESSTISDISILNSGNTLYVGGSGPGNYSSIQGAVDSASSGDIVFVFDDSSPYYENIIVNKTLNLIGEDKDTTVIDGMMNGNAAIKVSAENVNISGFSIKYSHPVGIEIRAKYANISGNNISECAVCGIICYEGESMIYGNNIFSNLCYGIYFVNFNEFTSNYNVVINNNIHNSPYGIWCDSSYNTISNNIITDIESTAIRFEGSSSYNTISGNLISNNRDGLYLIYECNHNLIYNNNILYNKIGIEIVYSRDNIIYHNNFMHNDEYGNAKQRYCIDNIWDDGYPSGGNYWDDYNGKDRNGDGIGDTKYYVYNEGGDINSDRYPLMQPWHAPDKPTITGTTLGKPGEEYEYTFSSTDPDEDDVYYYVDWGDDTYEEWVGPFASGEEIVITHEWSEKGIYQIRAKAKNTFGVESIWATLPVVMPVSQPSSQPSQPFQKVLQQFPNAFPILQQILGL